MTEYGEIEEDMWPSPAVVIGHWMKKEERVLDIPSVLYCSVTRNVVSK